MRGRLSLHPPTNAMRKYKDRPNTKKETMKTIQVKAFLPLFSTVLLACAYGAWDEDERFRVDGDDP